MEKSEYLTHIQCDPYVWKLTQKLEGTYQEDLINDCILVLSCGWYWELFFASLFVWRGAFVWPSSVDLSSPTRDWTWVLSSENVKSYLLDHQGIPRSYVLWLWTTNPAWCSTLYLCYVTEAPWWCFSASQAEIVEKNSANAKDVIDTGSISGLGRPRGERNGNPFQYSCLENSMYRGSWWAIIHGVEKSLTQLND